MGFSSASNPLTNHLNLCVICLSKSWCFTAFQTWKHSSAWCFQTIGHGCGSSCSCTARPPMKSAIPHSLFVRAENPFHLVLFTVPNTAAPSTTTIPLPSTLSSRSPHLCLISPPLSISQQVHILPALTHILNGLVTASRTLLQAPKETQEEEEEGVIVVMTSLPFSRIGLWGHKCGSPMAWPTLSAPLCYRNHPPCHCFTMVSVTVWAT